MSSLFFFSCYGDHRDLHSFPTRRSSDLVGLGPLVVRAAQELADDGDVRDAPEALEALLLLFLEEAAEEDRKSTRLNSSHPSISYAVFCLKKKKKTKTQQD